MAEGTCQSIYEGWITGPYVYWFSHGSSLLLLPYIFVGLTPGTASFCIMNSIALFLILLKLAVPRMCNSSHDCVLPHKILIF